MAALVWLLIPLVAAVAAACWGRWAARSRAVGDGASLAGYERFREAMQKAPAEGAARAAGTTPDKSPGTMPGHVRDTVSGIVRDTVRGTEIRPLGDPGGEDSPRGPIAGPVP